MSSVVRAQMGVSGWMSGHGGPGVNGAVGGVPIWRWRGKKVAR